MNFTPNTVGKWARLDQNGNHNLTANIWPIKDAINSFHGLIPTFHTGCFEKFAG